jgi:nucleotide-binding universal stress UspA family protein
MSSFRTISVGFDGSPDAGAAVRWAFELAMKVGAEVVVLHAVGLLEHATHPQRTAELEHAVGEIACELGIEKSRTRWHIADGDPCSVLLRSIDVPIDADLLVVGSRGRGVHANLLLGSTSHELAEHATVPVVTVPSR